MRNFLLVFVALSGSLAFAAVDLPKTCGHLGQVEPGRGAPEDAEPYYFLNVICNGNEAAEASHVLVFDESILKEQNKLSGEKSWSHQKGWLTRYKRAAQGLGSEGMKTVPQANRRNMPYICIAAKADKDPCAGAKTQANVIELRQVTKDDAKIKVAN